MACEVSVFKRYASKTTLKWVYSLFYKTLDLFLNTDNLMTDMSVSFIMRQGLAMKNAFNDGFLFGASTSAYQIEGAAKEAGKGPSIWDEFTHKKGNILSGDTGDVACDHYHRYAEDISLMQSLNLDAYRFSLSWARIMPEGKGKVNQAGLDFYRRLVDGLLEANITPFVTLFHWDLPLALYRENRGFVHRDTARYFADYVDVVLDALGDRVHNWITINEPFEHAAFGHLLGSHAPGHHRLGHFLKVMHHQLLGHGLAMARIRQRGAHHKAGITVSLTPILPNSPSPKDQWAADFGNQLLNYITLDPLYGKGYPKELQRKLRWFWPQVTEEDLSVIATPTDFIGVNHYNCEYASHKWYIPFLNSWISGSKPGIESQNESESCTAMGWEVNPKGMETVLGWLQQDYGNPPVYITENGAAYTDSKINGQVSDPLRQQYLARHIDSVAKMKRDGADIRGYFAWSLLDNFEWATGFNRRFGLIHVDYATQQRVIKQSGQWYSEFIAECRQRQGEKRA